MHEHRSPLILFLVKKNQSYGTYHQGHNSLKTASCFIVEMLRKEGHKARLAEAIDQNSIQTLIVEHNPSTVILEALWVTPKKMEELQKLNPKVRFVVRINSNPCFLAVEGIGFEWITAIMSLGIDIAYNSSQAKADMDIFGESVYLPNYYPMRNLRHECHPHERHVNVGCFGAMRILKNQSEQAIAAAKYANHIGKTLHFHMNDAPDGVEPNAIKKSVRAIVETLGGKLILHPWRTHEEFLELVEQMDICMQVSISESMNITVADAISLGVPAVGSEAIQWLPQRSKAQFDSVQNIFETMMLADRTGVEMNHYALEEYLRHSRRVWNEFLQVKHV